MLFSGSVKSYKCMKCSRIFTKTTPTSVIPILIVIIASTVIWSGNITEFFDLKSIGLLFSLMIGFILTIGFFYLAFVILDKAFTPWENQMKCTECGGNLEGAGGGFIDGATPGLQELIFYITIIVPPLGVALML